MAKNVFRAGTLVELIHAVFTHEGWVFVEGESKAAKLKEVFDITTDHRKNQFVATRRDRPVPAKKVGVRETVEYIAENGPVTSELGDEDHGYDVMIMMAAHLFDRDPTEVYDMVIAKREKIGE